MIDENLNINEAICIGCAACTEVCRSFDKKGRPAIQLKINEKGLFVPKIDNNTCTGCLNCHKVCAGQSRNSNDWNSMEDYFSKIGTCYYGYSLDPDHRFKAASGGIVTEIASFLLDSKEVDGVISSYQNENNIIVTDIFTSSDQVRNTRGSIYRQVPMFTGLTYKILKNNYRKLLVIGLPCHIAKLKTLQIYNECFQKVQFITIALFCKQTKTEEFSDFQRTTLRAKSGEKLTYRGSGWPGLTVAKSGKSLPFTDVRLSLSWTTFSFTPDYCFSCSDPLGLVADISVGDAWLKDYLSDKIGSSVFIAKNAIGNNIIKNMLISRRIFSKEESAERVLSSQGMSVIKFKASILKINEALFLGREQRTCHVNSNYVSIKIVLLNKRFSEFLYRSKLIFYTPTLFLKIYKKLSSLLMRKLFQ